MTYEEKLDLIIEAIIQARKVAVKNQSVKIYISDDNGLSQVGKDETRDILYKLQVEEKILSLNDIYNRFLSYAEQPKNLPYLLIDIRYKFDRWHSNYLIQRKTSIETLKDKNFKGIDLVSMQIEERLQTIYSRAIDSTNLKFFLLSLYEYVELFDTNPSLEPVYKSIITVAQEENKRIKELEAKANIEIEEVYREIKKYINKENVKNPVVLDELNDYESVENGTMRSSLGSTRAKQGALTYALMTLVEDKNKNHLKFCKRFGNISDEGRIISWDFSPSFDTWEEETKIMDRLKLTKVWYSWDKLVSFYSVYKDYEKLQKANISEKKYFDTWGLSMLNEEIKSIMEDKPFTARGRREYNIDEYKIHLQRVQSFSKQALSISNKQDGNNKKPSKPLKYAEIKGLFSLSETPVGVYYEGKNKTKRNWFYPKGKVQPYAILELAFKKHKRQTTQNKQTNRIMLSYVEIEEYIKDTKNCNRTPNWKGILMPKRRLEHLLKNILRIIPFTSSEIKVETHNNTAFLVFYPSA